MKGSRGRGHAAEVPLGWSGECRELTWGGTEGNGGMQGGRHAGGGVEDPQGSIFLRQLLFAGGSRAMSHPGFSPNLSLADPDPSILPYQGPLLF